MKKYRFIVFFCFSFVGLLILLTLRNYRSINVSKNLVILPTQNPPTKLASFLTSSPSKTMGWETYTNMDQGYSIDVPIDYIASLLSVHYEDGTPEIGFCGGKNVESWSFKPNEFCLILSCSKSKHRSLRSYIKDGEQVDSGIVANNVSWVTIGGKEAAREKMGNYSYMYYFYNNGSICTIFPENNQSPLYNEIFNKIISTFKFL